MSRRASVPRQQRGAATLVVVMVLFFIMAMMAAYANRNLVFEQRIASNYFRSGMALEMAEAGVEWATARLNGGLIDTVCDNSAAAPSSFRNRYLTIQPDRSVAINVNAGGTLAACIATAGQGWVCQCPVNGQAVTNPAVAASTQFQPMFGVTLLPVARPGVVRVQVTSCTDTLASCGQDIAAAAAGLARAKVTVDLALLSALKVPPASPLTVRGSVDLGTPGLGLHNAEVAVHGLLMQSGGSYQGLTSRATSLPGSPVAAALISEDLSLGGVTPERVFAKFFGMSPATYREQPVVRRIDCANDCGPALVQAVAQGAQVLWVNGPLSLLSNITLGTAAAPVLVIADGAVTLDGPMLITGLLHARGNLSWSNGSGQPALLTGALIVEGDFSAAGNVDIDYRSSVVNMLSNQRGSFVRVPGSWTDTP